MRKLVLLVTLVLGTTSWLACEAMDGDVLSPESEALLSAIGPRPCSPQSERGSVHCTSLR
jgi:hypothetical protein